MNDWMFCIGEAGATAADDEDKVQTQSKTTEVEDPLSEQGEMRLKSMEKSLDFFFLYTRQARTH